MPKVMIRCPNTGNLIPTGLEMSEEAFNRLPDILAHARCPSCGLEHAWWRREAQLVEKAD